MLPTRSCHYLQQSTCQSSELSWTNCSSLQKKPKTHLLLSVICSVLLLPLPCLVTVTAACVYEYIPDVHEDSGNVARVHVARRPHIRAATPVITHRACGLRVQFATTRHTRHTIAPSEYCKEQLCSSCARNVIICVSMADDVDCCLCRLR